MLVSEQIWDLVIFLVTCLFQSGPTRSGRVHSCLGELGLWAASVQVGIGGVQPGSSQLGHFHLSCAAVVQLGLWAASVRIGLGVVQLGSSQPGLGVVQLGSSLLGHSHLSWAAMVQLLLL